MLWIFLFAAWIIFNGRVTIEILIFGAALATGVYLFSLFVLGYSAKMDKRIFLNFPRIIKYIVILLWEIIKANIGVLKFVMDEKAEIKPKLVLFKTDLKTDVAKVALSNSITITPGTITVFEDDGVFCVHALDESMAGGLNSSVFVKQLKKMEEKSNV